jgi:peptide/nickel transport system substrate-binding protein
VIDTVPGKDVDDLKKNTDLNYKDIPSVGFNGIELNTTAEPFNNKALRQAVGFALDYPAIFKTIYFGVGAIANGPIPPSSWAFDPNFKPYSRDLAKAKQKLTEGGKPSGFSFKIQITAGSPVQQQLAELIRDELSEANITMDIEQLEFAKIVDNTSIAKRQFTAALIGWSGRIDPDGNMYVFFNSKGSLNGQGYNNPQVDTLLDKGRTATSQEERKAAYQDAQKIIMDDLSYIIYYHTPSFQAVGKKVQNFLLMADGIMRFGEVSLS